MGGGIHYVKQDIGSSLFDSSKKNINSLQFDNNDKVSSEKIIKFSSQEKITESDVSVSIKPSTCSSVFTFGKSVEPMYFIYGSKVDITSLYYSHDLISWNLVSGLDNYTFKSVTWNGSLWVAGGVVPHDCFLAYSTDGKNWTRSNTTPFDRNGNVNAITWNGSLWVAGGDGDTLLAYSNDGKNWFGSDTNLLSSDGTVYAVTWNGSLWVAGGNKVLGYSHDGKNWNASNTNPFGSTGTINAVTWNGSLWVAGGYGDTLLAYSTDGKNWDSSTTNLSNASISTIAWNGSLWVACVDSQNVSIIYSHDGQRWNSSSFVTSNVVITILWNGSYLILVTEDNLFKSTDAENWVKINTTPPVIATGLSYNYDRPNSIIFNDSTVSININENLTNVISLDIVAPAYYPEDFKNAVISIIL